MLKNLSILFVSGGLGAVSRWSLGRLIQELIPGLFPLGTLVINLSGAFLIGVLVSLFELLPLPQEARLFFCVGFLGAYTTFSAFTLETVLLLRDRALVAAFANIFISLFLGLLFSALGLLLGTAISRLVLGNAKA